MYVSTCEREHVLAGVLVARTAWGVVAGEALLVAVVHDGLATREVHQRVGELVPRQRLAVAPPVGGDERADAAHVVVAEERRQRVGVGVVVGVIVVAGEQVAQPDRRTALGERRGAGLEAEVERGLEAGLGRVAGHEGRAAVEHLAEGEEVVVALRRRLGGDALRERLPELDVDVLDGVDPEPIDAEVDPRTVDVGHSGNDVGMLGEQVVEPHEVAVLAGLAGERRVPAVVVVDRVVEPRRHLDGVVAGIGEHRRVRERHCRVERRERAGAHEVAIVERVERVAADVRRRVLVDVAVLALGVADHVGGVVGDDVEEDLDAPAWASSISAASSSLVPRCGSIWVKSVIQ